MAFYFGEKYENVLFCAAGVGFGGVWASIGGSQTDSSSTARNSA
jgi:hypothetical protein